MGSDNRALVVGYLKAALAAGRSRDFTAADELVAEDAAFHDPGPTASPSRSAHQRRWQELVGAFSELAFDVHDMIEAGDRVVVRWSMRSWGCSGSWEPRSNTRTATTRTSTPTPTSA